MKILYSIEYKPDPNCPYWMPYIEDDDVEEYNDALFRLATLRHNHKKWNDKIKNNYIFRIAKTTICKEILDI